MRRLPIAVLAVGAALVIGACGGSPAGPTPGNGGSGGSGGGGSTPPANSLPVIDAITVQGNRSKEPANFADAGESISVTARVRDDETAVDQLQYAWAATAGTFTGTGASVIWTAPSVVATPSDVTITLTVTERYGTGLAFTQSVAGTAALSLHDSVREVGGMSRQFLLDFSDTNIKDADYIMRNFGSAATCPDPREIQSERDDVVKNFTFYRMINFRVDQPSVTVNFGGACTFRGKRGDACAVVGVMWDSIDLRDNTRTPNAGNDIVAAAYSTRDSRWWLCASDYDGRNLLTGARISR